MTNSDYVLLFGFSTVAIYYYTSFVFRRGFRQGIRATILFAEMQDKAEREMREQAERIASLKPQHRDEESFRE